MASDLVVYGQFSRISEKLIWQDPNLGFCRTIGNKVFVLTQCQSNSQKKIMTNSPYAQMVAGYAKAFRDGKNIPNGGYACPIRPTLLNMPPRP